MICQRVEQLNKLHIAAIGLAVASTFATSVIAQETCGTRVVVNGDTLRNIAKETYGNARDYRYIFTANRAKFGISPHGVRSGLVLDLPCRGTYAALDTSEPTVETVASLTQTTEVIVPIEVETVVTAKVETAINRVEPTPITTLTRTETVALQNLKLVGFSDNQPYSDGSLLHGGLITTLIETALLRSEATKVDQPVFVTRTENGISTDALPDDFHLSFPWLLPDCDLGEFDSDIIDLCENYTFSAPIYEAQMTMYVLSDGPFKNATSVVDLVGARICRPSTMHTYDLLEIGMIEPFVSLKSAKDLAACFDNLQNDIVDVVSVNGLTADVHFAEAGHDEQIIELTNLVELHTVHAIAHNDSDVGKIALNYLNSGLWDMLANGEWGEVSIDYLLNQLD